MLKLTGSEHDSVLLSQKWQCYGLLKSINCRYTTKGYNNIYKACLIFFFLQTSYFVLCFFPSQFFFQHKLAHSLFWQLWDRKLYLSTDSTVKLCAFILLCPAKTFTDSWEKNLQEIYTYKVKHQLMDWGGGDHSNSPSAESRMALSIFRPAPPHIISFSKCRQAHSNIKVEQKEQIELQPVQLDVAQASNPRVKCIVVMPTESITREWRTR